MAKNENEFNAGLSAAFKAIRPHIGHLKLSERFRVGVSDFIIMRGGRAAIFESKYIRELPKRTGLVLGHPFEGEQQSFLKRMGLSGTPVFGLVGVAELQSMYLFPASEIPPVGNWTLPQFRELMARSASFAIKDVRGLVDYLLPLGGTHAAPKPP